MSAWRPTMDTIINALRQTDDGQYDNHTIARFGWVIITLVGVTAGYYVLAELFIPSGPAAEVDLAALQDTVKLMFATIATFAVVASVSWPARKIEAWLDARYPEHAVDDEDDYSLRADLHASAWFGGLWTFRLGVGYAVATLVLGFTSIVTAHAEEGYPLEGGDVSQLTVLNSFAIATLATLLAGIGFLWLINWSMTDVVDEFNTPETNPILTPLDADRPVATDGGEDDGA